MTPILGRISWKPGQGSLVLILAFTEDGSAVIVREGGDMSVVAVEGLVVERPTIEFPIGYAFSRVDTEKVPA